MQRTRLKRDRQFVPPRSLKAQPLLQPPARDSGSSSEQGVLQAAELIKTTNEDLAHTRTELFFFVGTIAFIVASTLGIGDRDLLVGTHVRLPILDVSIGFDEFLLGAPLLVLAVHFTLLLKFHRLRVKCVRISAQLAEIARVDKAAAENLELRTVSNFLTQ